MSNFNNSELRALTSYSQDIKRVLVKIAVSDTAKIFVPHYYDHIIFIGANDNNILIGITNDYYDSKFYFAIDDVWYCVLINNDTNLKNINFVDYYIIDKSPCVDCERIYYGDIFKFKTQNHIDFRSFIGA
jgi:hypothetical protein